jgi:hypothetical protein
MSSTIVRTVFSLAPVTFGLLFTASVAAAQRADSLATGARRDFSGVGASTAPNPTRGVASTAACTYDVCALRVEGASVVQGADGRHIAGLGVMGNLGEQVPWRSEEARRYAGSAQSAHRGARFLQAAGFLSQLAGVALVTVAMNDASDRVQAAVSSESGEVTVNKSKIYPGVAVSLGGTALSAIGGAVDRRARNLLARAVWWNNREIALGR